MFDMQVRCCCDPDLILGWMKSPIDYKGKFAIAVNFKYGTANLLPGKSYEIVTLEVARINEESGESFLAIKSGDKDVEFFNRIDSFWPVERVLG